MDSIVQSNIEEIFTEFDEFSEKDTEENNLKNTKKICYTFSTSQPLETDLKKLLTQVTGKNYLEVITEVKLKVVSGQAGLHRLSDYTPNLRILILDGSCIASFRDLGSNLKSLKTLSVARCNMKHLDGVWGFRSLQELNLRNNFIADPSLCSGVKKLAKLDLSNNELTEVSYFAFLQSCRELKELYINGNDISEYKEEIRKFLPQLRILDGEELEENSSNDSESVANFEERFFLNHENSSSEDESSASLSSLHENNDFEESKIREEEHEEVEDDEKENEKYSIINKTSTTVKTSEDFRISINSSGNDSTDISNKGDKSITHETANSTSGKLSSGRLICGNLAVSLRARNPTKNTSSSSSLSSSSSSSSSTSSPSSATITTQVENICNSNIEMKKESEDQQIE